jgi:hypothetical protein
MHHLMNQDRELGRRPAGPAFLQDDCVLLIVVDRHHLAQAGHRIGCETGGQLATRLRSDGAVADNGDLQWSGILDLRMLVRRGQLEVDREPEHDRRQQRIHHDLPKYSRGEWYSARRAKYIH